MEVQWFRRKLTKGLQFKETLALRSLVTKSAIVTAGGTAEMNVNASAIDGTTLIALTHSAGITLGGGDDTNQIEVLITGANTDTMAAGTTYYAILKVTLAGGEIPPTAGYIFEVEAYTANS